MGMSKKIHESEQFALSDFLPFTLWVVVEYKSIRHLYIQIKEDPAWPYVLVRAPLKTHRDEILRILYKRRAWLEEKIRRFLQKKGEQKLHWIVGQSGQEKACWIELFGERRFLFWKESEAEKRPLALLQSAALYFYVPSYVTAEKRNVLLEDWLKSMLLSVIMELVAMWAPRMGVTVEEVRIRKMRTRWGTCIPAKKRLWFSLMLVHKNKEAIEYVVVHELAHLLEPSHNARFWDIVEQYIPEWREIRRSLRYG